VFLFILPAPVRGFERNIAELRTWYQGMIGTSSEKGFGQRNEQNWSWINQSIIAMTHRLTRPVQLQPEQSRQAAAHHECRGSSFKQANWLVLAISLALGLGYVAVMPPASRRTPRSDRRGAWHSLLSYDGSFAARPAILLHVAVLSDDRPDPPRSL